jgi:hypothetical protein
VLVEDQDVRERFGITHYYQVAMFTEDSQGNPVFFCVRELPEGMPSGDSPRYGETVRVAGFFFKSWSYRIEIPMGLRNDPKAPAPQKQLAPLLLGRDLVWYPATAPQRNTLAGAIGVGLFCVAVAVVWIAVWRFNRDDRRRRFRTLGAGQPLDAGGALGQIELPPSPSPPDFSKLSDFDERPPSAGAQ